MATTKTHTTTTGTTRRGSNLPTTSLYVGSFDDNMCRGPQVMKPIDTSFITTRIAQRASLTASLSSLSDSDYDSAVLGDDDEHSEDELPPSPSRRHSGAMSISNEDLSLCYDRAALRRETAAHRARQQHHQQGPSPQEEKPTFAAHDQWDCEVDGPHMALWVPEGTKAGCVSGANGCKRRRTESPRDEVTVQHQVSYIEGPMMCLWEP